MNWIMDYYRIHILLFYPYRNEHAEIENVDIQKFPFLDLISKEDINLRMKTLNNEQFLIFMHVLHCFKTNQLPLRIYLSGSAGGGKITVINTILLIINKIFQ